MSILRRPGAWVFVILLASYSYFWHARDWNIASRLMLTYALVDRGTLAIDGLDRQTGDIALYRGHYYSDKTPGFSLLAAAPYAAGRWIFGTPAHPLNREGLAYWPADYWVTLATSGLLSALAGVILVGLARDLGCGPRQSALVGLTYGLATPAYAYATMSYGHQVAAFSLLAAFALLWRDGRRSLARATVAGFLASYAAVVEIQVGPVSAILGLDLVAMAAFRKRPISAVLAFGLGAAVPALILLSYNALAFGSPWRMGYFFEVNERFQEVHSAGNPLGLGKPDWSRLAELLWGERRGLIRFAPILALTIPGLVAMGLRRRWDVLVVSVATMAAVLLVNLSYPEWTGGWLTGPRLLVPLLPFAMLPVAALLAEGGRGTTALAIGLAIVGAVILLMFQGVGARVPQWIDRPMVDAVWPLWRGDRPLPGWVFGNRYARNLVSIAWPAEVKGLPVGASWLPFLPLVLFQSAMVVLMVRSVGDRPPPREKVAKPG